MLTTWNGVLQSITSTTGSRNQRVTEKHSKRVFQYTLDGKLVKIWSSTNEAGRNGFNQGNVVSCCNGKLKTHKGFLWSYEKL